MLLKSQNNFKKASFVKISFDSYTRSLPPTKITPTSSPLTTCLASNVRTCMESCCCPPNRRPKNNFFSIFIKYQLYIG